MINTQCKYVRFSPKGSFTSAVPGQGDVALKETNTTCKNNINIKAQDQRKMVCSSLRLTKLKKVTSKKEARASQPFGPLGLGPLFHSVIKKKCKMCLQADIQFNIYGE